MTSPLPRETSEACRYLSQILQHAVRLLDAIAGTGMPIPLVRLPDDGVALEDVIRAALEQAMMRAGGSQVRAARLLRLSQRRLGYQLRIHGLLTSPRHSRPPRKVAA